MTYTGHASKGSYRPIELGDGESRKIIEQGAMVLKDMQVARQAELKRDTDWLRARQSADVQEAQNLQTNFDLDTKSQNIRHNRKQKNYQVEADNARIEGENQHRLIEGLVGFSNTAAKYLKEENEKRKQKEFDAGYLAGTTGHIPIDEQMGSKQAAWSQKIAAESKQITGDYAASVGMGPDVVEGMRAGVSQSYRNGLLYASSQKASYEWKGWFADQLTYGEYEVELTDEKGKTYTKPASQIKGYRETAAAQAQLLGRYLQSRGLYGVDIPPSYIAGPLRQIGMQNEQILAAERKKEREQAIDARKATLMDTLGDNMTPETFKSVNISLAHDGMTRKQAQQQTLEYLFTSIKKDGSLKYTKGEINDIIDNVSWVDQPGVLSDRYEQQVNGLWVKRAEMSNATYNLEKAAKRRRENEYTDQVIDELGGRMMDDPSSVNDAEVEAIIENMEKNGHNRADITRVSQFLNYTQESNQDRMIEQDWAAQANLGALSPEEIMLNRNASNELKAKYLKLTKDYAEAPAAKANLDAVKLRIEQRANYTGITTKKHWTVPLAVTRAQTQYRKDVLSYTRGGLTQEQAESKAMENFNKEFDREAGAYATLKPTAEGGPAEGYAIEQQEYRGPEERTAQYREQLTQDPAAWQNQDMLQKPQLEKLQNDAKSGRQVVVPRSANYLALQLPGVSGLDVTRAQMDHYGLDSSVLDTAIEVEGQIDDNVKSLIQQYPTQLRAETALRTSAGVSLRDPSNMNAELVHAYTGGNIGPTSTGQHTDIKATDGSHFEYNHFDNYVYVQDRDLGLVPISSVPQTDTFQGHLNRGSHGRDYGTYSGDKIYLKNGAQVVSNTPTVHGTYTVFKIPGDPRSFSFLHGRGAT